MIVKRAIRATNSRPTKIKNTKRFSGFPVRVSKSPYANTTQVNAQAIQARASLLAPENDCRYINKHKTPIAKKP
jgi:hypothetical protein